MTKEAPICPFEKMIPSQLLRDDRYFMQLAYNQAIEAWRANEVPIGAVIAHEGRVIASAFNQVERQKDPTAHAEILVITQAARVLGDWRLNEAELFVTKEPCPMCSGATIMSRLGRVVYAVDDPKMGCMGGNIALYELKGLNHTVNVTKNILEPECKQLLQAFFALKRENNSNN